VRGKRRSKRAEFETCEQPRLATMSALAAAARVTARAPITAGPSRATFSTSTCVYAMRVRRRPLRGEGDHKVPHPRKESPIPVPPPKPRIRVAQKSEPEPGAVPEYSISRDKIRLMVELYHQSESFITMDNIDKRIDEALTRPRTSEYKTMRDLKDDLSKRNQASEYVRPEAALALDDNENTNVNKFSANILDLPPSRIKHVRAALWGTTVHGKPSLEIVEEQRQSMDQVRDVQTSLAKAREQQ